MLGKEMNKKVVDKFKRMKKCNFHNTYICVCLWDYDTGSVRELYKAGETMEAYILELEREVETLQALLKNWMPPNLIQP